MNCEEKDLFQKCQDIISDGKLSEDDVRQLSEYINASPNASDTLIGKQLVGPLQKVWVDGVVDEGNPDGGSDCESGRPGRCGPGIETCVNRRNSASASISSIGPKPSSCTGGSNRRLLT